MADDACKAVREAKRRTNWLAPDPGYEEDVLAFVRRVLEPRESAAFLADIAAFCARLAPYAAINSLSQTVWKLTAPGVPDIYRGAELWELSLVDPDNRRPVDFAALSALLDPAASPAALLDSWAEGRIKQATIARVLALRARFPALFTEGAYRALRVHGPRARHCVAWERSGPGQTAVVVTTRLPLSFGAAIDRPLVPPELWGRTEVLTGYGGRCTDAVSGRELDLRAGRLPVAEALGILPVAVLWLDRRR